jgi:hypothetical protein
MEVCLITFFSFLFLAVPFNETLAQAGVALPNPLGTTDVRVIIGRIIGVLTGASGSIALLMFIYGGFLWLTSMGNPERIKKGKEILIWSTLGMIIMFGAYIIVRYILVAITTGTVAP